MVRSESLQEPRMACNDPYVYSRSCPGVHIVEVIESDYHRTGINAHGVVGRSRSVTNDRERLTPRLGGRARRGVCCEVGHRTIPTLLFCVAVENQPRNTRGAKAWIRNAPLAHPSRANCRSLQCELLLFVQYTLDVLREGSVILSSIHAVGELVEFRSPVCRCERWEVEE